MFITDEQWELYRPFLEIERKQKVGRPRANAREVFEAILFMLHTGIQWQYLPKTFPPKSTVHDYLQIWSQRESFRKLFAQIIRQLVKKGRLDLSECHVDATFFKAKSGGDSIGLTRHGKGVKAQLVVDSKGIPFAASVASADQGEPKMVQTTLALTEEIASPERLIGDKAYDSDPLDEALAELGIEMISPHRKNRKPENSTQDGRALRRYRKRWHVERTIAWLSYHRRLLVRWEKRLCNYQSLLLLGCCLIAVRFL